MWIVFDYPVKGHLGGLFYSNMLYKSSYIFYLSTVLFSVLFAWMANVFSQTTKKGKKLHPLFWMLSFCCLWFVMGFRFEIGVDYFNYQRMFNNVTIYGLWGYYEAGYLTEPGYVLLLYLVGLFYGNIEGVFICSSFIGLLLLYRAFSFESEHAHPALCVFIFATTHYFYFFGIDRLFLAVSIVMYSLRFVLLGRNIKYYLFILLAGCFHVSSLFMAFLPFVYTSVQKYHKNDHFYSAIFFKQNMFRIYLFMCLVPLIFYALRLVIPYLPDKYQNYLVLGDLMTIVPSIAMKLPIIFLLFMMMIKVGRSCPHAILYFFIYISSVVIQGATILVPIGRLGWFFWVPFCLAFPIGVRSFRKTHIKLLLTTILFVFCIFYLFYAYLNVNNARFLLMFPYRNLFFSL